MKVYRSDIDFIITNQCENSCIHCVFSSRKKLENELSTDLLFIAFDNIKRLFNINSLSLTGGEPLCRNDFNMIYQRAHNMFNLTLITSGYELKSSTKNLLIKSPPSQCITSLYGLENLHNSFCNNSNAFDYVIKLLEFLKLLKLNKGINIVCHNENLSEIPLLIKYLYSNNLADEIKLIPLSPVGRGKKLTNLLITGDKWISFINLTKKFVKESKISFINGIKYERHIAIIGNIFEEKIHQCPLITNKFNTFSSCIHIDSNGDIYPCTMFVRNKKFLIGNILETENISLHKYYSILKDEIANILRKNCQGCSNMKICKRGCLGYHYSLLKDYRCNNTGYNFGCPDRYTPLN